MTKISMFFISFIVSAVYVFPQPFHADVYLEQNIRTAIKNQQAYFKTLNIQNTKELFTLSTNPDTRFALQESLLMNPDPSNPWYHFALAVIKKQTNPEKTLFHLDNALKCAELDIPQLWLLFLLSRQISEFQWSAKAFECLRKNCMEQGAYSVPLLSGQLVQLALQNESYTEKMNLFQYSSLLDHHPFWQSALICINSIPFNSGECINSFISCFQQIKRNWFLQMSCFFYAYQWIRIFIFIFIVAVLTILLIEYFTTSIHSISDLFPRELPDQFRNLLCIFMILSIGVLGILPLFIVLVFLLWFKVMHTKKNLLIAAFGFICLAPFDARIQEMFHTTLSPNQPLGLLRQAVEFSWNPPLDRIIDAAAQTNPDNHIIHTARAITKLKKNDLESSLTSIDRAITLSPADPLCQLTAANIYFYAGNGELAKKYYTQSLNLLPSDEITLLNLAQLNMCLIRSFEGKDLLEKAIKINPVMVNSFINDNIRYFNNALPPLRQFSFTNYTPGYFWTSIFPKNNGSWSNAHLFWKPLFFNLSVLYYFLCIALVLGFFVVVKSHRSQQKTFYCKLCGKVMCHKCRRGVFCQHCAHSLGDIMNETISTTIKGKIIDNKRKKIAITAYIINSIAPGFGSLYKAEKISAGQLALCLMSVCVFSSYVFLYRLIVACPYDGIKLTSFVLFGTLCLYTAYFFVINNKKLYYLLTSKSGA